MLNSGVALLVIFLGLIHNYDNDFIHFDFIVILSKVPSIIFDADCKLTKLGI